MKIPQSLRVMVGVFLIEKAWAKLTSGLRMAREVRSNLLVAHIDEMLERLEIMNADLVGVRLRFAHSLTMLQDASLIPCLAHNLEGWVRLIKAQGDLPRATRI